MRLIINQDRELVADLPGYEGPIPRVGEYIFHPPQDASPDTDWSDQGGFFGLGVAGSVKRVTHGIYARPQNGEKHFVGTAHPFVVIEL